MGIDTQKIQACTWTIFTIFISTCLRFVNSHPYVSSTLSFLFFLYVHYPLVFKFFIYSSPVLLGSSVYLRFHLNRDKQKSLSQNDKENKNDGLLSGHFGSVRNNINVEAMGVRRNFIETNKKEFDDLISMNLSKNENSKDSRKEIGGAASLDCMESSSHVSRNCSDDWFMKISGGIDGLNLENDDDEEETQEDRNKAVEWNEDNQNNLMELGTSEIERNKRLESLIAKRWARKVLSMRAQTSLIHLESGPPLSQVVAPILISRNNPFDIPINCTEADGLQIPGSAPSILQMKNPFDLPYDPNEEKPNLTGDSFEKDFMVAPKDLCFCRHESFSLGPSPWEVKPDSHDPNSNPFFVSEKRVSKGPIMSRFRRQSGENLAEQVQSLNSENLRQSEIARDHVKNQQIDLIKKIGGSLDYNQDTDKENDFNNVVRGEWKETVHEDDPETALSDFPSPLKESLRKSFSANPEKISIKEENINKVSHEPYNDSSPSAGGKPRSDEEMFYAERIPGHTPSFSIASDMQVEVSEIGSPPLTIGTVSPPDVESVSYEEGEIDKEIIPGSEELWGAASSHLSGIDKNELSSRAVHMSSEEDIVGVRFAGIKESSKDYVESMILQGLGHNQDALKDKVLIDHSCGDGSSISLKELQNLIGESLVVPSRDDSSTYPGEPYNPPEDYSDYVNFSQNESGLTEDLPALEDNVCASSLSIMHNTIIESNLTDQGEAQNAAKLNLNNSPITSMQPEFMSEHAVFDSSLPSSPQYVPPETIFNDQNHSSSVDHETQVDDVHFIVEGSSLHDTNPHIEELLVDKSIDSSTKLDHSVENTQEPSSQIEESRKEPDINLNANELLVQHTKGNDDNSNEIKDTESQNIAVHKDDNNDITNHITSQSHEELGEDSDRKIGEECMDDESGEFHDIIREESNHEHPEGVTVTEGEILLTHSSPSGEIHYRKPTV